MAFRFALPGVLGAGEDDVARRVEALRVAAGVVDLVVRTAQTGSAPMMPPTAATHSVAVTPIQSPSSPPSSPPSGMVPNTMNRTEAFIRPSNPGGHSRCRKLTWAML